MAFIADRLCRQFGCTINLIDDRVIHALDCPNRINEVPIVPPVQNVRDLATKRFEKVGQSPADHTTFEALEEARKWMITMADEGKPIDHVIIMCGRETAEGGVGNRWFQAGSYRYHAEMGLIFECQMRIRESMEHDG